MNPMSRCGVAALFVLFAGAAAAQSDWSVDYEASLQKAKAENKAVLLDFTGSDWCGWCIKLKDEVFSKQEFKDWAAKKAVLVELDFPRKKTLPEAEKKQNDELKKKFGITGYPTIVFVDGDGAELGRTGYVRGGPEEWIKKAEGALKGEGKGGKKPAPAKADAKDGQKAKPADAKTAWIEDLDEGVKLAKKEKKVVIADFTGSDWCGWCIKLKAEVFDTPEFKEWAGKKAVLVELDFPRKKEQAADRKTKNQELAKKYEIKGFPTIVVFDGDGKELGRLGYVKGGPAEWIKKAEELLGKK